MIKLRHAVAGVVLTVAALTSPVHSVAQAWTQPTGHAYLKVAHGRTAVSEQFDVDGTVVPYSADVDGNAFFDRSVYVYGEFGVLPGFTFVGMIPVKNIAVVIDDERIRTVGVGNVELRGRVDLRPLLGMSDDATVMAMSLGARVPTGYTRNLSPSVGSGQADLQFGLALGRSFYPVPLYAQVGAGFVNRLSMFGLSRAVDCSQSTDIACVEDRTPEFDNEWMYNAEAGVSLGSIGLLQILFRGTRSVNAPDEQFRSANPIATRQRFSKLGGGITISPGGSTGISLQVFQTIGGRNTIKSTDVFLGIEYRIAGL